MRNLKKLKKKKNNTKKIPNLQNIKFNEKELKDIDPPPNAVISKEDYQELKDYIKYSSIAIKQGVIFGCRCPTFEKLIHDSKKD